METNLKITILLLTWVMFNPKAVAQTNREVIWVHGYNETHHFWQEYAGLFETERRMNSNNTDYETSGNNGVPEMAMQISNTFTNPANTILVGHSMGGVSCAEIDRLRNGTRGIITVGSPMDGAAIANAVANGSVEKEVRYAVKELQAGPKAQFTILYIIYDIWTGEKLGKIIEDNIVDAIGLDQYSSDDSFTDLQEKSWYMNQPNRYRAATPKISIWGNENSPVHYRLASSAISNGANDTQIVNVVNISASIYLSLQRGNEAGAIVSFFGGFLNPFSWGGSAYAAWTASQWKRGKDYLLNSERTWKNLIKSTRYETTTFQVFAYTCGSGEGYWGYGGYTDINWNCWQWVTVTNTYYVMEPSDGFIHSSSQQGAVAVNWNPTTVEARGVNHMEMGTHPRTEQILREAWNGIHGNEFIIPK